MAEGNAEPQQCIIRDYIKQEHRVVLSISGLRLEEFVEMLSPGHHSSGPDSLQAGQDHLAGPRPLVQTQQEVVPGGLPAQQVQ